MKIDGARHLDKSEGDVTNCRKVLGDLHELEILHGDVDKQEKKKFLAARIPEFQSSVCQYDSCFKDLTCTKSNFKHGYIPKSNRRIAYWSTTKIFVSSCVCSGGKSHQDPYCAQLSKF